MHVMGNAYDDIACAGLQLRDGCFMNELEGRLRCCLFIDNDRLSRNISFDFLSHS